MWAWTVKFWAWVHSSGFGSRSSVLSVLVCSQIIIITIIIVIITIIIKVHSSGYSVLGNYAPLEKKKKRNENCRQGERLISAGHLLARRDGRLRVGESGELVSIIMFIKIFKIMIIMTIFMIKLMTTA